MYDASLATTVREKEKVCRVASRVLTPLPPSTAVSITTSDNDGAAERVYL